ncbi:MAG: hypothetical protein ACREII_05365 [Nitrospiraceae bacterium]
MTKAQARLQEERERGVPWKQWGPYLSERQWGTVRLIWLFGVLDPQRFLEVGKRAAFTKSAVGPGGGNG